MLRFRPSEYLLRIGLALLTVQISGQITTNQAPGICGFPGSPANGTTVRGSQQEKFIFHTADGTRVNNTLLAGRSYQSDLSYAAGDVVRYECRPANGHFIMFGDVQRSCQDNGTWTGTVPTCDLNIARGRPAAQSSNVAGRLPHLAVDGKTTTCSFTESTSERRWWQVSLGDTSNIAAVAITIADRVYQKMSVYVVSTQDGGKIVYEPCGTFEGIFETETVVVECVSPLAGQFVFIRDDRAATKHFVLCEVEVFTDRVNHTCGEPEIFARSSLTRVNGTLVSYSCQPGYKPSSAAVQQLLFTCFEGRWQQMRENNATDPPAAPFCQPVTCPPPDPVKNAFVELLDVTAGNTTGDQPVYVFGTAVRYGCREGFTISGLAGDNVVTCNASGQWENGNRISCREMTCSTDFKYRVDHGTLLNRDPRVGSQVKLLCDEGFEPVPSDAIIGQCTAQAQWILPNATCEESSLPAGATGGLSSLVTAFIVFAVIAILCLIAVIGYAFYKRYKSEFHDSKLRHMTTPSQISISTAGRMNASRSTLAPDSRSSSQPDVVVAAQNQINSSHYRPGANGGYYEFGMPATPHPTPSEPIADPLYDDVSNYQLQKRAANRTITPQYHVLEPLYADGSVAMEQPKGEAERIYDTPPQEQDLNSSIYYSPISTVYDEGKLNRTLSSTGEPIYEAVGRQDSLGEAPKKDTYARVDRKPPRGRSDRRPLPPPPKPPVVPTTVL